MTEVTFRVLAGVVLFSGMGISVYFRRRADRESGERIPRSVDGTATAALVKVGGVVLWLSPMVYLVYPPWMAWAAAGWPEWARVTGAAGGLLCVAGVYWLFSSIGSGISPTSATRREHRLVTRGPYRWVRHPLYTIGASLFLSFGLMADNWFIALLGVLAFIGMAWRTPKEEANLVAKFGDEYREYMARTGRFFPRFW